MGCWRTRYIEDSEECKVVGWSIRETRDRYRRITDRCNEKVKGVAFVVCREVHMVSKVEISK